MDERSLRADMVDETLDCIRLRSQRNRGVPESLTSGKMYCLIPLDAIRKKVPIVRFDNDFQNIFVHDKRKMQFSVLTENRSSWTLELFYVDRYYYDCSKTYEHNDDR